MTQAPRQTPQVQHKTCKACHGVKVPLQAVKESKRVAAARMTGSAGAAGSLGKSNRHFSEISGFYDAYDSEDLPWKALEVRIPVMKRSGIATLCLCLMLNIYAAAQNSATPLRNEDVIALKKASVSDDLIILKIQSAQTDFKLDVQDIVELKQANVSDAVLAAMMKTASRTTASSATAPDAKAPNTKAVGKVYVYRYKQFVGSMLEPSVYADEIELARMDNGKYFVVELPAGKHNIRSNDKQSTIELNVEPEKEYYVRVEIATGAFKGHGRLVLMSPEQGTSEVKRLKVLDVDKVRDHERVVLTSLQ